MPSCVLRNGTFLGADFDLEGFRIVGDKIWIGGAEAIGDFNMIDATRRSRRRGWAR